MVVRVLITVSPQMHRVALALCVLRHRPEAEVLLAPPEATAREVGRFAPHLLVRDDTDRTHPQVLGGVPCLVEVAYSDGMDTKMIGADGGRVSEERVARMENLLRLVDEAGAGRGLVRDALALAGLAAFAPVWLAFGGLGG